MRIFDAMKLSEEICRSIELSLSAIEALSNNQKYGGVFVWASDCNVVLALLTETSHALDVMCFVFGSFGGKQNEGERRTARRCFWTSSVTSTIDIIVRMLLRVLIGQPVELL